MFAGTRVPVQTLLDYLEAGESLDDFLEGFPTVSREQVVAFLEEAKNLLVAVVDGQRLVLEKREAVLERAKRRFSHIPSGVSLAEELIAERRAEARREEED